MTPLPPPPPPPLPTSFSIFYLQCPLQNFHRGFIVMPSSKQLSSTLSSRKNEFFSPIRSSSPLLATQPGGSERLITTRARHQIFSFFDETLFSKAKVSLFFCLLIFFFSFFFTVLDVLYDFSACVSLAMFSCAFVLPCLLLRFSFSRMSS